VVGEDAGVLSDIGDGIPDYFDRGMGTVFRMDIDGAAGNPDAHSLNVGIVVDAALDDGVVDPENIDDGAATADDLLIAVDIEVQVRGILGIEPDGTHGAALPVEHVAGVGDRVSGRAGVGDVDVHRRRVARDRLDARGLQVQDVIVHVI